MNPRARLRRALISVVGRDQGSTEARQPSWSQCRRKAAEAPHEPLMAQDAEKARFPPGAGNVDRTVGEGGAKSTQALSREIVRN